MKPTLLIIDDDNEFRSDFILLLKKDFDCIEASNNTDGFNLLLKNSPDIVLLDLMLNDGSNGLEFLKKIKSSDIDIPVIMITDYAEIETAVEALKLGAIDYITKTPNLNELKIVINQTLNNRLNKIRVQTFQEELHKEFSNIIGVSKEIEELRKQIALYSKNRNTILITGESGVGKEIVARQIHHNSNLKNEPFIALNCSAISKYLLESELFGHEKGAFTGANKKKHGKFELAENGTLFLDEISELDIEAQVKLLRVLQFKSFERVGGNKTIKSNARIIAATNRNLLLLVQESKFREDLFYRLNVLHIHVPPLRERKKDIPALVDHFITMASLDLKVKKKSFDKSLLNSFLEYNWPGNVRELQNYVIRSLIVAKNELITEEDLGNKFLPSNHPKEEIFKIPETWNEMNNLRKEEADKASRKVEKLFLENLLKKFKGNISKAAEHIGINRTNLHKMINKCGL